ncbi:restriction endonuclease subunit S [Rheinheimera sp. KL1]|uniref:restriction endonuclease subunit S n=1 Tax=Rheinheimera sp. KL1 TaxID=1635005 RepID=UPI0006A98BDA|nr:restriction endonuclease subunit S [Rheinheimera sp. KL1]KOO59223.1 restriction endonuclease subunit S [Rheinheimera sp. KL1]
MTNALNGKLGSLVSSGGGKIHTGPFGSQLHASDYVPQGVPCIMPANMKNNRVDLSNIAFITEADAKRLSKYIVKENDIVYSRRGDVTQKALIRKSEEGYFCGTGCLLLRPGNKFDARFLTYYLSTSKIKSWIVSQAVGATMPNLNTGILSSIPFHGPEKPEQVKVADVLSAVEDKIELNNRINTELEAMVKTLYDYWFVQFDFPDANGKPYKTSGGKMVYNPILKREIPEGWSESILGNLIKLERGVTYGKEDTMENANEKAIGILRATNVTGNIVDIEDLVYVPASLVSNSQVIRAHETIIVMSSGSKEHVGKNGIYYFEEPMAFGAFCSKVVPNESCMSFVNTFLQSNWFRAYIKNQCLGTNINNLTGAHINRCPIVLPTKMLLEKFEEKAGFIYKKISVNANENQKLKILHDWLLPMLMNGQVTIK